MGSVLALLFLLLLATLVAYAPGLSGGFVFDDEHNIVEPPGIHWTALDRQGFVALLHETNHPSRITANFTFALNHLFSGLDPLPYHWTNVVIHLAAGLALLWFLLQQPAARPWPALAATALFLLHPINIQAVTYVVQRMASLAALFSLLSFSFYLLARRRAPWAFLPAVACWLVAVGAKPNAILLPALILLYEYAFFRERWPAETVRKWSLAIFFIALAGAFAFWHLYDLSATFSWSRTMEGRDFTGQERLLSQARVQFFYLSLLLWPHPGRFNLDHTFVPSVDLFTPWTTLPLVLFWLGVLALGVWLLRRVPRFGFPILGYCLWHVPESAPINLELVFEHRLYLPMTMLALLFYNLLLSVKGKAWLGVLVLLGMCGGATYSRNEVWGDPLRLLADTASKSPGKFRPLYNYGSHLGRTGQWLAAGEVLQRALAVGSGNPAEMGMLSNQLGNIRLMAGGADEALGYYRRAVAYDDTNAEALYNLARQLDRRGRFAEAEGHYRRFLQVAGPYLAEQVAWVRRRLPGGAARGGALTSP